MATAPRSIPADLVQSIVSFLWSLRLSRDERITLMKSMPLFNSTWRDAYIRASTKDVYIPCVSYTDHFFSLLRRESRFYDKVHLEARCRSITFAISCTRAPQQGPTTSHPADIAMVDILRFISDDQISYVPNLRKIAIHYHNIGFDDTIFHHSRLVDFPSQVTELEIVHTFSPEMPDFLKSELRDKYEKYGSPRYLSEWHLWITVCPNIVNLELDLSYGPLREICIRVPDSLQRLILHSPENVDPSQGVLSAANVHVECLPSVHYPSREVCLVPGMNEYVYSVMKCLGDYAYLFVLYYPANVKLYTWKRWYTY
ncbi:hypothetical protein F5887DRAFT_1004928 [Amanita rubescens]|nr:hypothetical protein F5887DRAFT_1004928 [Amanita rubescens]